MKAPKDIEQGNSAGLRGSELQLSDSSPEPPPRHSTHVEDSSESNSWLIRIRTTGGFYLFYHGLFK